MKAVLTGTTSRPAVLLSFPHGTVTAHGTTAHEWVKALPERTWDPETRAWRVTSFGVDAAAMLRSAGFDVVDEHGAPASLADLVKPYAIPGGADGGLAVLMPRLGGVDAFRDHLGASARNIGDHWLVDPYTLAPGGVPVPWCELDPRLLDWLTAHPAERPVAIAPLDYDGTLDGLRGVPVVDLYSVSPTLAVALSGMGISCVYDLLHTIPRRYLDMANPVTVAHMQAGATVAMSGRVQKVTPPRDTGGMWKARIGDETGGVLFCRWFNASRAVQKMTRGMHVLVYGEVEKFTFTSGELGTAMTQPLLEEIDPAHEAGLIGIYPASEKHGVSTWAVKAAASEAVARLGDLSDPVPPGALHRHQLVSRLDAFRGIHDPKTAAEAAAGRRRVAYDELLRLQVVLAIARATNKAERGIAHTITGALISQLVDRVPFPLTYAQAREINAILRDLADPAPMERLLQGDVSSGKTLVALAAMLAVVEDGGQAALMVPSDVLATQHAEEIATRLAGVTKPDGTPVSVALLGKSVTGKARKAVVAAIAGGSIDIVVGTHALIAAGVSFHRLTLAVIDEQHRFGVSQRAQLRAKGAPGHVVDMLYATATPVPRTAMMTVFGDLDVSVLDEMPPGRVPIATSVVPAAQAPMADPAAPVWATIRQGAARGEQAFVVCPRLDSQAAEERTAVAVLAELSAGALAGLRLGLLTGKMNAPQRHAVMSEFAAGDIDVLIATTVVEVGVNIPNATGMVVLSAHKFGLAQLHQIRGRVGRGTHPGWCVLIADPTTKTATARLEALADPANDGFVLAELDLGIRGSGNLMGSDQSGRGRTLKVASVIHDTDLLALARDDASRLIARDPKIGRYPGLRNEIAAAIDEDAATWLTSA